MTMIGGRPVVDGIWTCHCGHAEDVGTNILKALNAAGHVAVHIPSRNDDDGGQS